MFFSKVLCVYLVALAIGWNCCSVHGQAGITITIELILKLH